MDHSAAVLPLQSPKDVSVADIEHELSKVWSSKGEHVAARAATFNLIVYESLDITHLSPSSAVESIATQNPCRVIDLREKPGDADEAVEAQVAAYCPINRDRSSLVCCEYITMQAPGPAFARMCSTVASLLIQDLPIYLWWQGNIDLKSSTFQQLVSLADRVIVDSEKFIHPEQDLEEIHQLTAKAKHCGDLNWQRLNSWQELTAQAFDPPDRRQALVEIDRVTLDYNAPNPCQAFLFLGWLASRLQWTPVKRVQSKEHDYLIDRVSLVTADQRPVEAELAAVPLASETAPPGELIGVRLTSTNQVDACTVLCSETTGCMRMETMGGAQACQIRQVSAIEHAGMAELLELQLQRIGADRLFEESLQVAYQILSLELTP